MEALSLPFLSIVTDDESSDVALVEENACMVGFDLLSALVYDLSVLRHTIADLLAFIVVLLACCRSLDSCVCMNG